MAGGTADTPVRALRRTGDPGGGAATGWYKAQQLADTYWLYVVWDPQGEVPELVRMQNPAARLDHAEREIVAARFHEIPAEAIVAAARRNGGG